MPERQRTLNIGAVPVPPTYSQLGILVLDGSGSMDGPAAGNITKAQAVNGGVREMLTRFGVSRQRRSFSFAVITFDEQARVHLPITAAEEIDDNADYDPTPHHGGGTDISTGLREAHRLALEFLQAAPGDIPASVVIVLMSDGLDDNPVGTLRVAAEIETDSRISLCTAYFGTIGEITDDAREAQDHLRALATSQSTGFKTVYDADTLRKFFTASVSTTVKS